jgi:hypothetical protein
MKMQIAAALVAAGLAVSANAAMFTPGNLAVVVVGDGSGTLGTASAATFIREYTPAGVLVQTITVPTIGADRFSVAGSANTEGHLTLSGDGRYLTLGGYNAAPGTASIASSTVATNSRAIARIDMFGTVDTSTKITNAFSGASIRSVATPNGTNFYAMGGNSGIQLSTFASTSSTQVSTGPGNGNSRVINIFNNQLFVSAGNGTFGGVGSVSPSLPAGPGAVATIFSGVGGTTGFSPNDFFLADLNPLVAGPDTLYVATDNAGNIGLNKYNFNGTTWVSAGLILVPAGSAGGTSTLRHLTGSVDALGNVTLFGSASGTAETSANRLMKMVDSGGIQTWTTLATTGTNTVFRGVDFIPVPTPGALAMLAVGGVVCARRRRA